MSFIRFLSRLIIPAVFLAVCLPFSYASDAPMVWIGREISLSAPEVEIPVWISNAGGAAFTGFALRLNYNDTALSDPVVVPAGKTASVSPERIYVYDPPADGVGNCSVSIFSFTPDPGEILVKLKFNVSPNYQGQDTVINFVSPNIKTVLFDQGASNVPADFSQCSGDVNNDYNIGLADAVMVLKLLSGENSNNAQKSAAIIADTSVGMKEAIYIIQSIAGLRY